MKKIPVNELKQRVELHQAYLNDNETGEKLVLHGYDLRQIDFRKLRLCYADFTGSDLSYADLCRVDLSNACLSETDLSKAYMYGACLRHAILINANLTAANLRDASLPHANLSWANLQFANLIDADLRNACLFEACLDRVNLLWADLRRTNLKNTGLLVFQAETWTAYIQKEFIRIGCQHHAVIRWKTFSDKQIAKMSHSPSSLEWWNKYKDIIFAMVDTL